MVSDSQIVTFIDATQTRKAFTMASPIARRHLIGLGVAAASATCISTAPAVEEEAAGASPVFVATWPFGKPACDKSLEVLTATGKLRDAVQYGIEVAELDESNHSVGYGGFPNADGVVQLDAVFMDGDRQQAGGVAGLEGYRSPIAVARKVMEETPHALLVGDGAAAFAQSQGFEKQELLTEPAKEAWIKWKADKAKKRSIEQSHDTIALLGLDSGHLMGGCSTSGLAFKLPGRVGDSPLVGSGLYVDGDVGAAGATGVGENVLRYCASFLIVEYMRDGLSPTDACEKAIRRVMAGERKPAKDLSINFVALDRSGRAGAAGTDAEFRYAVVRSGKSVVLKPRLVK
ncbi:MAG: N(4)-(beta-N-acetylglucosaminyl)-L-asparaginase [Aureliella sp.]